MIRTAGLTKRFGRQLAVDNLSLEVPRGSVFAFLGRNGSGKTTTFRILMDLLDKTAGTATILGLDCARDALALRQRVGYMAEGQSLHEWMKVREAIWFHQGFYPTWDGRYAEELRKRLGLPAEQKVGQLSRGMQAKLALLLALSFRPELLLLDEPTGGLDVVVRRDFIREVIGLIQEEGRTILLSSHLVHEVEHLADWVGIIDSGRLVWCSSMEDLAASFKRLVLTFPAPPGCLETIPHVLTIERDGRQAAVTVRGFGGETVAAARRLGATEVVVEDLSLESIFVALVGEGMDPR